MRTKLSYVVALFVLSATVALAQFEIPKDFTPLFNGKDFTVWNIEPNLGAWHVEDGRIICKGEPKEPYLILTNKEYQNFELYADFKMSENCNSGILLSQLDRGWARESYVGFEIQVSDDAGKANRLNSSCGAVYNALIPIANPVKPNGHWNRYYIIMDWPILKVWLNGTVVQDVNLEEHDETRFKLRKGYIGLQNHGKYVEYKNVCIKELPSKEKVTELFNGKDLAGWVKLGDANWSVSNGEIIATGGDGWLVSEKELENYELRVFAGKYENGGTSGIYYNWNGEKDPGFKTEFLDWGLANKMDKKYLLTQIINSGKESSVRNNGVLVQSNKFHNKLKKGKVAIFHSRNDGVVKIPKITMKELIKTETAK